MRIRYIFPLFSLVLAVSLIWTVTAQTRTIDPSRFNKAIAVFENEDKAMLPPEDAIVITGSSTVQRWHSSIKKNLAPLTVIPRGFGGSTMADVLHFVDRIVIPYKPRAVVIYEGDNDTGAFGVPPVKIADELKQIISTINKVLPQTRIYVISVKPSPARWGNWDKAQEANEFYKEIAGNNDRVSYIDIATPFLNSNGKVISDIFINDGLHLNEKGTRIWAANIKAALMAGEAKYE